MFFNHYRSLALERAHQESSLQARLLLQPGYMHVLLLTLHWFACWSPATLRPHLWVRPRDIWTRPRGAPAWFKHDWTKEPFSSRISWPQTFYLMLSSIYLTFDVVRHVLFIRLLPLPALLHHLPFILSFLYFMWFSRVHLAGFRVHASPPHKIPLASIFVSLSYFSSFPTLDPLLFCHFPFFFIIPASLPSPLFLQLFLRQHRLSSSISRPILPPHIFIPDPAVLPPPFFLPAGECSVVLWQRGWFMIDWQGRRRRINQGAAVELCHNANGVLIECWMALNNGSGFSLQSMHITTMGWQRAFTM